MRGTARELSAFAAPVYGPATLFSLAQGAILPVVPLVATGLGASPSVAALLMVTMGLGSFLGSIPGSILAARLGERRVVPLGGVIAALTMVACWWAPTVVTLGAALFGFGFASAVFTMARQSYLTDAVPFHLRARALSTLGGVFRIGLFFGPFLGAAVITLSGIRGVFLLAAAATLAAGIVSLSLPDTPADERGARPSAGVKVGDVLRANWRTFATVGVALLLVSAVRACRQVGIPLWAEHIGLDAATTSLIYGVANAVDMVVFYPAGHVMDRYGRRAVAVPSAIIMGVGFALIPFTDTAWTLLAASVVIGFGNGIGSGLVMTVGADLSPDIGRPQFLGVNRFFSEMGTASGPAVVSALTGLAGLGAGMWSVAVTAWLAALLLWTLIPSAYRRVGVPFQGVRRRG